MFINFFCVDYKNLSHGQTIAITSHLKNQVLINFFWVVYPIFKSKKITELKLYCKLIWLFTLLYFRTQWSSCSNILILITSEVWVEKSYESEWVGFNIILNSIPLSLHVCFMWEEILKWRMSMTFTILMKPEEHGYSADKSINILKGHCTLTAAPLITGPHMLPHKMNLGRNENRK